MGLARFLHIAALALLFGAALVPWYAGGTARLDRPLRMLFVGTAVAALVSALAWFALLTAEMSGVSGDILPGPAWLVVLTQTAFGPLWAVRGLLLLASLGLALFLPPVRRSLLLLLATAALASLSLTGHAGSSPLPHQVIDALHALAAGAWVGGLAPLLLILVRRQADPLPILQRFSAMAMIAVAVLLVSGLANAWLRVGGNPWSLAGTAYGALLLAKLLLLALMLALAAANRFFFMPRLPGVRSALTLSVGFELLLGLAVLALAAALGMTEPPA